MKSLTLAKSHMFYFYNFLSDYKFCKVVAYFKANFSSVISTLNAYQLLILQIY